MNPVFSPRSGEGTCILLPLKWLVELGRIRSRRHLVAAADDTTSMDLTIVLRGLKGELSVAELCNQQQINQSQYYRRRDRLLADGPKGF